MILARPISWTHLSKLSNRKTVGLHTDVPLLVPKFTFWCAVSLLEWMNIISKKLKAAKPSRLHRKVVLNMTEILCLLWECRTSNDNDIYFVQQDESAVHTERNSAIELKHKHTHTHTHIYIYIYIYVCIYITVFSVYIMLTPTCFGTSVSSAAHAKPTHKQQYQGNDPLQNPDCICRHLNTLLSQDNYNVARLYCIIQRRPKNILI